MNTPVLKYPPGSEWLYLRLYGGAQALEEWLTGSLAMMLARWRDASLVSSFHFVHYLDPDYHLRVRFFLPDPVQAGILMKQVQESCTEMLEGDLIWKIEVGTYEPEYDRFGVGRMHLVERWFEVDSLFWLDEIRLGAGDFGPEIWKRVIRSIDFLLTDFGATLEDKIEIVTRLRNSSAILFGMNKSMKGDIDEKFRKMAGEVIPILDQNLYSSDASLKKRSMDSAFIVSQIQNSFTDASELFQSDLLPNLIHMSLNRAFRTRHRMQELVVYDFLARFFESVKAREKKKGRRGDGETGRQGDRETGRQGDRETGRQGDIT